ncbi:protein SpAN-like [Saccoglossus kowalevskii]|uniref:Metalloendopeptidase n=1 Tax=Saccoglossus kowalevskii TaxID=10224 RepID=A0ABM0N1A4_SACKO|nr:PREDICTED: protein SpAN-like [Saccoglossus kowalevskii]
MVLGAGLGSDVQMGVIAHEIGHAIGFWHEQSRPDRDNYVRINSANIEPGKENNFNKYDTGTANTYNVPYDIGSIMHYGEKYFSVNGQNTIDALNSDDQAKMGNRAGLTNADVTLAKLMYDCPECGAIRLVCRDLRVNANIKKI